MILQEILDDIHTLGDELKMYEIKFGVLSDVFYESYKVGEEPENDDWAEDWEMWAGVYEIRLKRKQQYQDAIHKVVGLTHPLAFLIGKAARRESILVPA